MGLKQYKPVTSSQRGLVLVESQRFFKGKPFKALTSGLSSSGGRNNHGHLTARRKGGGHKRKYRIIDFKRKILDKPAKVERIEYDPNRTSFIALIKMMMKIFRILYVRKNLRSEKYCLNR